MTEHGLKGKPSQVYNCDESGIPLQYKMVVFTGKHFNAQLSNGEVPGTLYGMSPNGWIDQELFSNWFLNISLHTVCLKDHSFYCWMGIQLHIRIGQSRCVIIFCLLPNTIAGSQPLDTSCFGPLKTYWFETCCQHLFDNPSRIITKFQFSSLFAQAWSKGITINNIVSEFCSAGKKEWEMTRIARGEEKKCKALEAEKNKKRQKRTKRIRVQLRQGL